MILNATIYTFLFIETVKGYLGLGGRNSEWVTGELGGNICLHTNEVTEHLPLYSCITRPHTILTRSGLFKANIESGVVVDRSAQFYNSAIRFTCM